MAVQHEQYHIHLLGLYWIAFAVFRSIGGSFLEQSCTTHFPHKREVHSLELTEYVFLRWATIEPGIVRLTKPVESGEQAIAIRDELVVPHEPSGNIAQRLVIISEQGTSYVAYQFSILSRSIIDILNQQTWIKNRAVGE